MTQWYDSGLAPRTWRVIPIASFFSGSLIPHAETTRWSYTVPSNKVAFIRLLTGHINRFAAPTVVGIYQVAVKIGTTSILVVRNWRSDVGVMDPFYLGLNLGLVAGQTLSATTSDNSSGGGVVYGVAMVGVEAP